MRLPRVRMTDFHLSQDRGKHARSLVRSGERAVRLTEVLIRQDTLGPVPAIANPVLA
jgi:hypothetical protein